jgi:hypothetical protein
MDKKFSWALILTRVGNSIHIRLVTLLIPSAALCFSTSSSINLPIDSSNRLVLVNERIRSTFTANLLILGCPITQRGHWIEAILLNMHSTSEDKTDTTTHRSYKTLKHCMSCSVVFLHYLGGKCCLHVQGGFTFSRVQSIRFHKIELSIYLTDFLFQHFWSKMMFAFK